VTKPTLLIVEDVKKLREDLRARLIEDFDVVGEAADGVEAVELFRELEPNLVVMDIVMPRLSGIEATTEILAEFPRAKIVILSGLRDEGIVLSALQAGAIDYFFKPVEIDRLKQLLQDLVTDGNQSKAQVP